MTSKENRPLKVFLCHASGDKPPVRDLYKRLVTEGVDAWLDQEKLLPGQDWRSEIPRAVQESDVVVIFLSKKSITKEGYVQKEIKFALDIAEEKPEGAIFLIPARLEDCIVPERLSRWQWVDLYEENGFIKLLRSLKLRAGAVGAVIEPVSYEDTDKERGRRIEQLYTEGLAAFYTEDWDKACRRFQSILSEQPNHPNAAEKLEEARCQSYLANLYARAIEAYGTADWMVAIHALEELLKTSQDYKDAAILLKNAKKQNRLKELYSEAKTLHSAQKWRAVLKVFEQIKLIEPAYQDVDGLLPAAQKEVAELDRVAELNEQYSHALREMDAKNWYEARRLLENIHKSQTGFLETEKLLKKVENEILKDEEQRQQKDHINTLYEQAHGLLRSKKWNNILEKLEQIRELDEQFIDIDGIAEKARQGLERDEQETERQDKLAALYAESVKLLKDERYQDALDKWQDVKAIDPKYPDRQWVQKIARKKLTEIAKKAQTKPRLTPPRSLLMAIAGVLLLLLIITTLALSLRNSPGVSPSDTLSPTGNGVANVNTKVINTPYKTSTPYLVAPLPTQSLLELPVQIRILTTSDWTTVTLQSGGQFKDMKILSSSPQLTQASFESTLFRLIQPIGQSGSTSVEIVAAGFITNTTPGEPLVFRVERGHIGKTTVELLNTHTQPILVQTLNWDGCCYDPNARDFEVPAELFIKSSVPVTAYRWDFVKNLMGWGGVSNITVPRIKDAYLSFTSTSDDPYIFSPDSLHISASDTPIITIRMLVGGAQGGGGSVYFVTSVDIYWNERKRVDFHITDDGKFHTYDIHMAASSTWKGEITQFRLDPTNAANANIKIDYISVHSLY